jgi:hypothetical protein
LQARRRLEAAIARAWSLRAFGTPQSRKEIVMTSHRRTRSQVVPNPLPSWPASAGVLTHEAEALIRIVRRGRRPASHAGAGIQLIVHGLHGARIASEAGPEERDARPSRRRRRSG